jgi:hypothetical protein
MRAARILLAGMMVMPSYGLMGKKASDQRGILTAGGTPSNVEPFGRRGVEMPPEAAVPRSASPAPPNEADLTPFSREFMDENIRRGVERGLPALTVEEFERRNRI